MQPLGQTGGRNLEERMEILGGMTADVLSIVGANREKHDTTIELLQDQKSEIGIGLSAILARLDDNHKETATLKSLLLNLVDTVSSLSTKVGQQATEIKQLRGPDTRKPVSIQSLQEVFEERSSDTIQTVLNQGLEFKKLGNAMAIMLEDKMYRDAQVDTLSEKVCAMEGKVGTMSEEIHSSTLLASSTGASLSSISRSVMGIDENVGLIVADSGSRHSEVVKKLAEVAERSSVILKLAASTKGHVASSATKQPSNTDPSSGTSSAPATTSASNSSHSSPSASSAPPKATGPAVQPEGRASTLAHLSSTTAPSTSTGGTMQRAKGTDILSEVLSHITSRHSVPVGRAQSNNLNSGVAAGPPAPPSAGRREGVTAAPPPPPQRERGGPANPPTPGFAAGPPPPLRPGRGRESPGPPPPPRQGGRAEARQPPVQPRTQRRGQAGQRWRRRLPTGRASADPTALLPTAALAPLEV